MIKLDYSIESPEERNELVKKILNENPNPDPKYLEVLGDYLILCMEKQEKKEKKILTDNRASTIAKRETSFEGFVDHLETGEDLIYNLMTEDKTIIFRPRIQITKKDVETIPFLKQLREEIKFWEQKVCTAKGKDIFKIKKMLIEMRKDQYVIKNAYLKTIMPTKLTKGSHFKIYPGSIYVDCDKKVQTYGLTLLDPETVKLLLHDYSRLKSDCWDLFRDDLWYIMKDLDDLIEKSLKDYPVYETILISKIDGLTNLEIKDELIRLYGEEFTYTSEYISRLWCNKIPKLIATKAFEEWIDWYYTNVKKGKWKKCSRCGQIKLADSHYFSKNNASGDGLYSICKKCRNTKKKKKGE